VNSDRREEHPVPKFAPRLGFAWDPTGSGKTSVRSSFSYGYAFLPGLTREDQQGSNPWGGRETVTNVNFSNPFGYVVTPNVKFTPRGLFETTPYDTPVPSYSTWNFAVLNPTGAGGTGPIGFFGPTMQWNAGGDQHCNALLLSVQRALNLIASGWKWSGIYRFTSGTPLMIQDDTDAALSAINHQQPNLVLPNSVYTGQSGPGQFYFNKAAFAAQSAGTFTGNLGWNSLRGPTDWDMDMALSREFRISKIQFALKYTF